MQVIKYVFQPHGDDRGQLVALEEFKDIPFRIKRVYYLYDTKENWDAQSSLVSEEGVVYIYSNYTTIEDQAGNQTVVAGIKIGDGTSYLIDLPYITDAATYLIISHVSNTGIHVTQAEKEFWNNKVSAYINHTDAECLEISKRYYELNGEIIEG